MMVIDFPNFFSTNDEFKKISKIFFFQIWDKNYVFQILVTVNDFSNFFLGGGMMIFKIWTNKFFSKFRPNFNVYHI